MRMTITAVVAVLFMTICTMHAQQRSATSAPPPGSAGIYKSGAELGALQKAIAAANGNQSLSPIANTGQYRINVVHREKAAGALAHQGNTELHYIIEGTAVVVTGGAIGRGSDGINSATIQGGETRGVKKGYVIIVPFQIRALVQRSDDADHVSRGASRRTKVECLPHL